MTASVDREGQGADREAALHPRRPPPVVGWERLLLPFDRKGPAHVQLMRALIEALERGDLPAGVRLPSGRDLARMLGIGRNTALAALSALVDQGYLVSKERSGVFVADRPPAPAKRPQLQDKSSAPDWRRRFTFDDVEEREDGDRQAGCAHSFLYGQFDASLFPVAAWRECERAALSKLEIARWGRDMIDEDDVDLVEELRKHVLPYYGIWARQDEILITLGGQQGRYLVAQLLSGRGTIAGMENPGMPDMAKVLRMTGAEIRHLAVDEQGLVTSQALYTCDTVYVTTDHQNPTTATMPIARRYELLAQAAAHDFVLVEDTFETEFVSQMATLPSLKGMEGGNRVVHVGSLSKLMAPGLRLGYVVAPPLVISRLRALRRLIHRHPPGNNQRALAIFIRHGHYRTYQRRAALELDRRSKALGSALNRWLPDFRWRHRGGTSTFWIELPNGLNNRELAANAARHGVLITSGDRYFHDGSQPTKFIRLSVSTIDEAQIDAAVRLLATARGEAQSAG